MIQGFKSREFRLQVFFRVRMRSEGRTKDVCVRNISSRGMLLQAAIPPDRGSYIEIFLPQGSVTARVVWASERRFGVHTREKLDIGAIAGGSGIATPGPAAPASIPAKPTVTQDAAQRLQNSRRISSAIEFGFVIFCAAMLSLLAANMLYELLDSTAKNVAAHL